VAKKAEATERGAADNCSQMKKRKSVRRRAVVQTVHRFNNMKARLTSSVKQSTERRIQTTAHLSTLIKPLNEESFRTSVSSFPAKNHKTPHSHASHL
jgi:hypothetical protein